jgi:uncharacterized membrane protein YgcG
VLCEVRVLPSHGGDIDLEQRLEDVAQHVFKCFHHAVLDVDVEETRDLDHPAHVGRPHVVPNSGRDGSGGSGGGGSGGGGGGSGGSGGEGEGGEAMMNWYWQ